MLRRMQSLNWDAALVLQECNLCSLIVAGFDSASVTTILKPFIYFEI